MNTDLRKCNEVFSSMDRWNIVLLFISYNGERIRWYIGWREYGNFGIKFIIRKRS